MTDSRSQVRYRFEVMTGHSEGHAQLVTEAVVPDLAATVSFLSALGFEVERVTGPFAVLRWEEARLFVAEDSKAVVDHRWVNVRVMVPSADAMRERVARLGGRIVNEIGDRDYGLRDFVVLAPGGLEIRFAERLP